MRRGNLAANVIAIETSTLGATISFLIALDFFTIDLLKWKFFFHFVGVVTNVLSFSQAVAVRRTRPFELSLSVCVCVSDKVAVYRSRFVIFQSKTQSKNETQRNKKKMKKKEDERVFFVRSFVRLAEHLIKYAHAYI
jgi:hypothetical protein